MFYYVKMVEKFGFTICNSDTNFKWFGHVSFLPNQFKFREAEHDWIWSRVEWKFQILHHSNGNPSKEITAHCSVKINDAGFCWRQPQSVIGARHSFGWNALIWGFIVVIVFRSAPNDDNDDDDHTSRWLGGIACPPAPFHILIMAYYHDRSIDRELALTSHVRNSAAAVGASVGGFFFVKRGLQWVNGFFMSLEWMQWICLVKHWIEQVTTNDDWWFQLFVNGSIWQRLEEVLWWGRCLSVHGCIKCSGVVEVNI